MTDTASRERLMFADVIGNLRRAAEQPWLPLRGKFENKPENRCDYSALIPTTRVGEALTRSEWELNPAEGGPGVWSSGDDVHTYYRTGSDNGVEPLLHVRTWSGVRPSSIELLEEFRLFHNLWRDDATGNYVKFDDAGDAVIVARPVDSGFEVLARSVRQFLAWKDAHLALYVVWNRYSERTLDELGFASMHQEKIADANSFFDLTVNHCNFQEGFRTIGRLVGKVLVPPLPREQSGFGPYEEEHEYQSFIVGVDGDGKSVELSCAPEVSEDYYLVPVWFRVDVLKKYQSEPERYEVTDGQVNCVGLWDLPVDNDHKDHVAAFLGDLRVLPDSEQRHWRSHNIPPAASLSETAVRRSFMAEWATSERPEHRFARAYAEFMQCFENLGIQIIRPLTIDDEHCLKTLHVPYGESVMDFDQEVVKLTKLLVDSINDRELAKHITLEKDERSIRKLEKYLAAKGRTDSEPHTTLLRNLYNYRSQNAAHRRGSDAYKSFAKLVPGVSSRREVLAALLAKATAMLDYLREVHNPAGQADASRSPS